MNNQTACGFDRIGKRSGAKSHSAVAVATLRSGHLAAIGAADFAGATIVTTHTAKASNANDLARAPSMTGANDPTPLTLTDLDAVAGGGGPAGVNPSRSTLRV